MPGPPPPGPTAVVDPKTSSKIYVVGWLVCCCFIVGVACVVGLTFKPTSTFTSGQTYGEMSDQQAAMAAAKTHGDDNPKVCKACALNPYKLYLWSFGIPILVAILVAALYALYLNKNKAVQMKHNFKAAFAGQRVLQGQDAADYRQYEMTQLSPQQSNYLYNQQQNQNWEQQQQMFNQGLQQYPGGQYASQGQEVPGQGQGQAGVQGQFGVGGGGSRWIRVGIGGVRQRG